MSIPLHSDMVTWPGRPPVNIERILDSVRGGDVTLFRIEAGLHAGTHIEAPLHFFAGGASIDRMPTEAMIGPARVIGVEEATGSKPPPSRRRELPPARGFSSKPAIRFCGNGRASSGNSSISAAKRPNSLPDAEF